MSDIRKDENVLKLVAGAWVEGDDLFNHLFIHLHTTILVIKWGWWYMHCEGYQEEWGSWGS